MRRRVNDRPRFVQIAADSGILTALDDRGDVWRYEIPGGGVTPTWVRLERGREEIVADPVPAYYAAPMSAPMPPSYGMQPVSAPPAGSGAVPIAQVVHNIPPQAVSVQQGQQGGSTAESSQRSLCRREGCEKLVTRQGSAYCEFCIQEMIKDNKEKEDVKAKPAPASVPNGGAAQ
jgi:hypothetical protein